MVSSDQAGTPHPGGTRSEGEPGQGGSGPLRTWTYSAAPRDWGLALGLFCLVTILYTFPLVLHLEDSTLQLGLNYAALANSRIIQEQLSLGASPLESGRILAPTGYTIHEGFLPSLLSSVLGLGVNPLLGLNLSLLLSFILAALGAWALAFTLTGSRLGALAAGLYYGFCAIHYANYPIYPVVHIEWLPWFLYGQIRYFASGRVPYLVLVGTAFVAASLCSWYFTVFLFLAGLVLTAAFAWARRGWARVARFLLAIGLASLVLIPFSPIALLGREGVDAGGLRYFVDGSADLLSFFLPSWFHWLLAAPIWKLESHWLGNTSLRGNYLGTISLGLALWGLAVGRVPAWLRRALWILAGAGLILALGPFLAIGGLNGWAVGDPISSIRGLRLPYYWLADLFPFSATRATARFALLTTLVLSLGLAFAVARIELLRARRVASSIGVFAVLWLEFWPLWPSAMIEPLGESAAYRRLAQVEQPVSVLELPFRENGYRVLYCSTWHHLDVVGGAIDKPFGRFRRNALRTPFLRELFLAGAGGDVAPAADIFSSDPDQVARAVIRQLRIEYAVVHKWDESILSFGDYFVEEPLKGRLTQLLAPHFQLEMEDDQVQLFRSTVPAGPWIYSTPGQGWGGIEAHGDHVERVVLGNSAGVQIHSSEDCSADIDLELAVILVPERDLIVSLNGEPILTTTLARRSSPTDFKSIRLEGVPIRKGVNSLEIRTSSPVPSIAEVYGGSDQRPIAFVVKRLETK